MVLAFFLARPGGFADVRIRIRLMPFNAIFRLPYPGPVLPAHIPTPPQMKFEVWREADVAFLEEEEDWWHELNLQPKWQVKPSLVL